MALRAIRDTIAIEAISPSVQIRRKVMAGTTLPDAWQANPADVEEYVVQDMTTYGARMTTIPTVPQKDLELKQKHAADSRVTETPTPKPPIPKEPK